MSWNVKLSSKAEKYFNKLNKDMRNRIKSELITLSQYNNPLTHNDVKPLEGQLRGFCRLKIGHYRLIFSIIHDNRTIAVVNIAPRGDIY